MAVLSDANRWAVWADYMRKLGEDEEQIALLKPELRAAFNAADDWVEANRASYNSALPLPARTALTARQKAALLMIVIRKRFEVT